MQFNVDCAIGIMNYIINNQKIDYASGVYNVFYCTDFYNADSLKNYDKETIYYTIIKLKEGGYIDAVITNHHDICRVFDIKGLTLRGHEFCEHMKEPTTADKVKKGFKEIGKHSLSYAETVIKECLVASSREATKIAIQQSGLL